MLLQPALIVVRYHFFVKRTHVSSRCTKYPWPPPLLALSHFVNYFAFVQLLWSFHLRMCLHLSYITAWCIWRWGTCQKGSIWCPGNETGLVVSINVTTLDDTVTCAFQRESSLALATPSVQYWSPQVLHIPNLLVIISTRRQQLIVVNQTSHNCGIKKRPLP